MESQEQLKIEFNIPGSEVVGQGGILRSDDAAVSVSSRVTSSTELLDNYPPGKVYHADTFEAVKRVPDESVDLVVTDPPYFIEALKTDLRGKTMRNKPDGVPLNGGYVPNDSSVFYDEFDHFENVEDFQKFMRQHLLDLKRIMKPKSQCYLFCSTTHQHWLIQLIKDCGFIFYKQLIWYHPNTMCLFPNQYWPTYDPILWFRKDGKTGEVKKRIGCSQRDVFEFTSYVASERAETGGHPTPKPLALIRRLILNGSDEGDVVFDGFMGSGTTAVAAQQTKRNFLGFEKDGEYLPVIEKRLAQKNLFNIGLSDYLEDS